MLTPHFRAGFVSLFRASKPKDSDNAPKFSVQAFFPPTADLKELKAAASEALVKKFGADQTQWPKSLRSPFRRNEELDKPNPSIPDDWIVMTFSATEDRKPGLVDARNQDIIDDSLVYSGCWMRADVNAYGYEKKGNKGVAFGLNNVQKVKDDEPIGTARIPASKVFEPVEGASEKSGAAAFFD